MLRRAFLAAVALLLTGRLSNGQQRPTGEQTVPEVLNVQGLITQALRVATRVEEGQTGCFVRRPRKPSDEWTCRYEAERSTASTFPGSVHQSGQFGGLVINRSSGGKDR